MPLRLILLATAVFVLAGGGVGFTWLGPATIGPSPAPLASTPTPPGWTTFTYQTWPEASLPRPADWTVAVLENSPAGLKVEFTAPSGSSDPPISLTVVDGHATPTPTPTPTPAADAVLWRQSLRLPNAAGEMFVLRPAGPLQPAHLMARYPFPKYSFELVLSTPMNQTDLTAAQTAGFPPVIARRYSIFETMAKGVSLFDPQATPEPTPEPIPEWSTHTTPQGVLLEYPTGWQVKVIQDSRFPPTGPLWWGSFRGAGSDYEAAPSFYYIEAKVQPPEMPQPPAEIAWERRVMSGPVEGVIQVVGSLKQYKKSDVILDLKATYLHPGDNLKVEIMAKLGDESRSLVRTQGLTTTIEQNFQPFLHMAETVKFGVAPTPAPTRTPTPTPILWAGPPLTATTWATFTYATPITLSLRYPAGWDTRVNVYFPANFSPPSLSGSLPTEISMNVWPLPMADRFSFDPRYNDNGWNKTTWLKPVNLPGAAGFIYLIEEGYYLDAPLLNANLYSEDHELAISFSTAIRDGDSLSLLKTQGITDTLAQRFQIFEYMVNSVHLPPLPVARPTATPIPNPLPQPPVASGWLTTTISNFTLDYPADWWLIHNPIVSPATSFSGRFTLPEIAGLEIPSNYVIYYSNYHFDRSYGEEIPSTVADLLPRHRPGISYSFANPRTGISTPLDDYEVLWQKQVGSNESPGLMYVLGKPEYWRSDDPVVLYGVFYYPQFPVDFRLFIILGQDSLDLAQSRGFEAMVAQRFQLFAHMVNSVRLAPPQ
jgi:hypothetical protein